MENNNSTNELLIKLIDKVDEKIDEERETRRQQIEALERHSDRLFQTNNRWIFGLIVAVTLALIGIVLRGVFGL
jgi:uncharacterized protein Yka (UPF0111/DUF47 family)